MSKIAIVTDAWHPQINGVVTTLTQTIRKLEEFGHTVKVIAPGQFKSIPCPTYPEIRLSLTGPAGLKRQLDTFSPDCIHIATEGPLGWAARKICRIKRFPFTTSYHTRFPEYIRMRIPIPLTLSYSVVRKFHKPATRIMVATEQLDNELGIRKFKNIVRWSRGVDTDLFKPGPKEFLDLPRPVSIFVGRVAVEKNIEEFLKLDLPGTKVIVGDGPARKEMEYRYSGVVFTGYKKGAELAAHLAAADVFVFPSLTDTFGVVMLEAMACGIPVAAHPVTGPVTIVKNGVNGWLDNDLKVALEKALEVSPDTCRKNALQYSWESCTSQFLANLDFSGKPFN